MRADGVKVHFDEARGHAPADAELRATVKALERPMFAYSLRDRRQPPRQRRRPRPEGRGPHDVPDGEERRQGPQLRDAGEPAQPVGRGPPPPRGALRHLEHDAGRRRSGWPSRSTSSSSSPIPRRRSSSDPRRGSARGGRREGADADRRPADRRGRRAAACSAQGAAARTCCNEPGRARRASSRGCPAGIGGTVLGTSDGYVEAGARRRALRVRAGRASSSGRRAVRAPVAFEDAMAHAPPALELPQPQLATRDPHTLVHGDGERRRAAARRVHLRRLAQGLLPVEPQRGRPEAAWRSTPTCRSGPGVNVVTVVARENPDTTTHRTFIVRRDGAERRAPRRRRRPTTS